MVITELTPKDIRARRKTKESDSKSRCREKRALMKCSASGLIEEVGGGEGGRGGSDTEQIIKAGQREICVWPFHASLTALADYYTCH